MTGTDVGLQRDHIDSFNDLVPAVLGLMNMLDDLTACLDEPAAAIASEITEQDELLVSALLGLICLQRSVHRWIDPILATDMAAETPQTMPAGVAARGLMR